jgi:hypothetical protein
VLVLLQTISVFLLKWIFPCSDSRFIIAYDILQYLKVKASTPCLVCQTARKSKLRKTDQILGDLFQSDIPSEFDCLHLDLRMSFSFQKNQTLLKILISNNAQEIAITLRNIITCICAYTYTIFLHQTNVLVCYTDYHNVN